MLTYALITLGAAALFGHALAAPMCVQDGQCAEANSTCCGHHNYTDYASCGYNGVGAGCCRTVCENVTSLVLAKLRNGSNCAAIRKQEGVNEGADMGFCDVLYENKNYSCDMVCTATMYHLLGPTCVMAANGTTSNPVQICAASGPCGTGTKCGCIKNGQCLLPMQDSAMCCSGKTTRTTSCHYGHERQGHMCGGEPARYKCIDNKCQVVEHGGASRAVCESICG